MAIPEDDVETAGMPIAHYVLETAAVADFVAAFWEPSPEGRYPGLRGQKRRLPPEKVEEIHSLTRGVRFLQSAIIFELPTTIPREQVEEAKHLVFELGAAAEVILDDGVYEPADKALEVANARLAADNGVPTLIQGLSDLTMIAREKESELAELDGFDMNWLTEAETLIGVLTASGLREPGRQASANVALRNRFITLLDKRVSQVRKVAGYAYRHHPDVLRKVTSAYERTRRAESRRKNREQSDQPQKPAYPPVGAE